MFLKIKQEASGFPAWVTSEEQKQQYIDTYHEKEGIALTPTKIQQNSGLRTIAKNCLNGLWGKFGERENKRRTVIVSD
jgi:hypothetical protein